MARRLKLKYNCGESSVSNKRAPKELDINKIEIDENAFALDGLVSLNSSSVLKYDFVDSGFQFSNLPTLFCNVYHHVNTTHKGFRVTTEWQDTAFLRDVIWAYRQWYLFSDDIDQLEESMETIRDITSDYVTNLVALNNPKLGVAPKRHDVPVDMMALITELEEPLTVVQSVLETLFTELPIPLTTEKRKYDRYTFNALVIDKWEFRKQIYLHDWSQHVRDRAFMCVMVFCLF